MDLSQILGLVVKGALGGKRKKSRRAQKWISTGRGSPLLTTGALMTAAGVAWGLFETWQNQKKQAQGQSAGPVWPGQAASPAVPATASSSASTAAPPSAPQPSAGVDPILRLVRLTVAAARADGTLSDGERAYILDHARQAGVEDVVLRELDAPVPVAEIVRGVDDPSQRRELYSLAYTIVRADEDVSNVERIWLAQLAVHLDLDTRVSAEIESEVVARIDAAPDA